MKIVAVLAPIWAGIVLNIAFSVVNVSLFGHYGPWASRWVRYSPWVLVLVWAALIGLAIFLMRTT